MECVNTVFPIILYILGAVLLLVLIIVCFKVMETLKKINTVVDDVNVKASKLNNVFNLIDTTTEAISTVSDKVIDFIVGAITNLFTHKKKKEEFEDEE